MAKHLKLSGRGVKPLFLSEVSTSLLNTLASEEAKGWGGALDIIACEVRVKIFGPRPCFH